MGQLPPVIYFRPLLPRWMPVGRSARIAFSCAGASGLWAVSSARAFYHPLSWGASWGRPLKQIREAAYPKNG